MAIALSYVIDGILLTGFALTGTISFVIPLVYTAVGLFDSSLILLLHAWAIRHRRGTGGPCRYPAARTALTGATRC